MYISVDVDLDCDDVLRQISDDDLEREFLRRKKALCASGTGQNVAELCYAYFRKNPQSIPCELREAICDSTGRIL